MNQLSIVNQLLSTFNVEIGKGNKCWSVGSNRNGQQANSFIPNKKVNKKLSIMNKLPNNIYIDDIKTGCWGSTYILCNDQKDLIVFGCNESGQLSIDFQVIKIIILSWLRIFGIHPIFCKLMITHDIINLIQLNVEKLCTKFQSLLTPLYLEWDNMTKQGNKNNSILFISSGIPSHHKFILTSDELSKKDHLYGMGRNDNNQLGLSDKYDRNNLTAVKYFNNVSVELAQIHCTRNYTHFLSEKGELCESSEKSIAVRPIKNIITICDVCCGYEHTLAINENNWVYSWGDNLYGQLGML